MCENVIEEVLERAGRWGKFQLRYYTCLGFVVLFSTFSMSYIFTARDVKYRCFIRECETPPGAAYNPKWLVEFAPFKEGSPSSCLRFAPQNNTCTVAAKNETVKCDAFVYQRRETTIVHDFHVHCEENLWKLTLIGTINVVGELVCLAYSGFISDKYGRKELMVISVLLSTITGILRSFSLNYLTYASLEFLDTALGGGMYGAAFILAMEIVGSKDRNVGNTIISCIYALGQAILGATAWLSPTWRIMLRILYTPGLVSVAFFWTVPESIRWLLSANRTEDAKAVVLQIARQNGKEIPPETLDKLKLIEQALEEEETNAESFLESIKSPALLLRTIHCSATWICCTFVYYGLTIHSVAISESVYSSFIFAVAVEVPGYVAYYYANERMGRRLMMFLTLISAGLSCVAVGFVPEDLYWLKLGAFLIGKCCSTMAYTVLYVYTTEMFPTNSRHSTFSICSMFGRLGSMVAPQVPLLARVSKTLPLLMFGLIACSSGAAALLFPETLNIKLPDTIEEAVNIGKNKFDIGREWTDESSLPLRTERQSAKM